MPVNPTIKALKAQLAAVKKENVRLKAKTLKISHAAIARSRRKRTPDTIQPINPFSIIKDLHPLGARPPEAEMALDDSSFNFAPWALANMVPGAYAEGQEFLGYPTLALMAQRTEYRTIVKVLAGEMTRKWIEVISVSDDRNKQDKINKLEKFMKKLRVRQAFRRAAEVDFYFGRSHMFTEINGNWETDKEELKTPIGGVGADKINPDNQLTALRVIEPEWVYPLNYNTSNPLSPRWYKPEVWFVMGQQIHSSRLLRFCLEEVSDLLKPAYSFGGLSQTQKAKPYVENFLRQRQNVSDFVRGCSTYVLKTNMDATLKGDEASEIDKRVTLFANYRDNSGVMVVDHEQEDFSNVTAPINGLDRVLQMALEQICIPARIALVKYTGITPSGLNATSRDELQAFAETIRDYQETAFDENLRHVFHRCQLSLWGEIDEDLDYRFEALTELTELEKSGMRVQDSQVDSSYFEMGVLDAHEIRQRIAEDPDTIYPGIDVDKMPATPEIPGMEGQAGGPPAPEGEGGAPSTEQPPAQAQPDTASQPLANVHLLKKPDAFAKLSLLAHDAIQYPVIQIKRPITAYHATWKDFDKPDFSYLGENTGGGFEDLDESGPGPEYRRNTTQAGFWTAEKPPLESERDSSRNKILPFRLTGRMIEYPTTQHLNREIKKAGGPEKYRESMVKQGIHHATIKNDTDWGQLTGGSIRSYITFHPDAISRADKSSTQAAE